MRLDAGTVLLQWAAGGLFFLWVTTRRREVGLGYGWLLRSVFLVMAVAGAWIIAAGARGGAGAVVSAVGAVATALVAAVALAFSITRRGAGVRAQRTRRAERAEQVAAMAGRARARKEPDADVPEFPPALDLGAAGAGLVALLGAAAYVGGPYALSAFRLVAGALFFGALTDAMLLGHWYLVQPGLARGPIKQMVVLAAVVWPFEIAAYLWPVGMTQVLDGTIDDGFDGLLGWTWLVCAATTIVLLVVTWLALRERYYSAVMAATGLLYLAILTGFGTDLIARAVLAP